METYRESKEILNHPEIRELIEKIRKNIALADIVGEQHTAQSFTLASEIRDAFQGKLEKMNSDKIGAKVAAAKEAHNELIQEKGITDEDLIRLFEKVWVYSRLTNPTNELLEEVLSLMEDTEKTAVFASGLAAINATVQQFTGHAEKDSKGQYWEGDKIVVIGGIYGGTFAQMQRTFDQTGRQFEHLSISDFMEKGLPNDTAMVFFEACNNPTLKITPITDVVTEAERVRAITVCDNTFTPLSIQPSQLGVDLTIHSMTKYIGGRSEDLGGSVSGNAELIDQFNDLHKGERMVKGAILAPRSAKEFLRNLEDLPERLFTATKNAQAIRETAEKYNLKARTLDHYKPYQIIRNSELPISLQNGMVGLYFENAEGARAFVDAMTQAGIGKSAVSLGSTTTYYSIPSETTHSEMPEEEQERVGITEGLVRISCGVEKDLVPKFEEVLRGIL